MRVFYKSTSSCLAQLLVCHVTQGCLLNGWRSLGLLDRASSYYGWCMHLQSPLLSDPGTHEELLVSLVLMKFIFLVLCGLCEVL